MDNPLKKLFSKISGLGAIEESSAIGIDIGSSAIKVVEIKKRGGRAILETYGSIALGPDVTLDAGRTTNAPVEKIAEALTEVLKQAGVTQTSGGFAIPVQSSLIFTIELPVAVKETEMTAIVSTEARKYIPV